MTDTPERLPPELAAECAAVEREVVDAMAAPCGTNCPCSRVPHLGDPVYLRSGSGYWNVPAKIVSELQTFPDGSTLFKVQTGDGTTYGFALNEEGKEWRWPEDTLAGRPVVPPIPEGATFTRVELPPDHPCVTVPANTKFGQGLDDPRLVAIAAGKTTADDTHAMERDERLQPEAAPPTVRPRRSGVDLVDAVVSGEKLDEIDHATLCACVRSHLVLPPPGYDKYWNEPVAAGDTKLRSAAELRSTDCTQMLTSEKPPEFIPGVLPLADLRERLQMLKEAGVEEYRDGPIVLRFSPEILRTQQELTRPSAGRQYPEF